MEGQKLLTASQIRYLLTMKRLDGGGNGVRGAKVAAVLGFTNPSVHLIRKTAYGVANFTDAGRKAVVRYSRYYEALFRLLASHFPSDAHLQAAVYALLAELPEESLDAFCAEAAGGPSACGSAAAQTDSGCL